MPDLIGIHEQKRLRPSAASVFINPGSSPG